MTRALIAVLDSFGVGATDDAAEFGDTGASTFGHIAAACAAGKADKEGLRAGPLVLPNLSRLGLLQAARTGGSDVSIMPEPDQTVGLYGCAAEKSRGKDTPSGHWEMMGLPVEFDWGYFPTGPDCFPRALLDRLIEEGDLPGVLGNCHASGTTIIEELGEEHIRTGKPIVYTSADSVFQIAAHESHFGLERLLELCAIARRLVDEYNVGRVIARPFVGETPADFTRTGNRRDLATPPHAPTLLNVASDNGRQVIGIGKIGDIFAYSGITRSVKAHGNDAVMTTLLQEMQTAPDGAILFANFVDFDTLFGHRRNVPGYAAALEGFDAALPRLLDAMEADDILVLTADHGCDPTWPGSDHTREHVPVLAYSPALETRDIGRRDSFADIGQSLASWLDLPALNHGTSFL